MLCHVYKIFFVFFTVSQLQSNLLKLGRDSLVRLGRRPPVVDVKPAHGQRIGWHAWKGWKVIRRQDIDAQ